MLIFASQLCSRFNRARKAAQLFDIRRCRVPSWSVPQHGPWTQRHGKIVHRLCSMLGPELRSEGESILLTCIDEVNLILSTAPGQGDEVISVRQDGEAGGKHRDRAQRTSAKTQCNYRKTARPANGQATGLHGEWAEDVRSGCSGPGAGVRHPDGQPLVSDSSWLSLDLSEGSDSSFLPQDKVAEFARMSPQELLKATEDAAGDKGLKKWHEKLTEYGKEVTKLAQVRAET